MSDRTGRKLGTLRPIVYYENRSDPKKPLGYAMLAPETSTPNCYTPEGWEVCEAGTLAEVTKLQKKLEQQEFDERDVEVEAYKQQFAAARAEKRANLVKLMTSPDTSANDKQFIEIFLQVREDRREKYIQRFYERNAYLNILAFDEHKAQQEIIDKLGVDR